MNKNDIVQSCRNAIKELNSICQNPAAALYELRAACKALEYVIENNKYPTPENEPTTDRPGADDPV